MRGTHSWLTVISVVLMGVGCHAQASPPASPESAHPKTPAGPLDASHSKPTSVPAPTRVRPRSRPTLPPFYDAARMAQLSRLQEGVTVLAFRRSPVTGVLTVLHERVSDAAGAAARFAELAATGFEAWPPPPAPELAVGSNAPDLEDCPFLIASRSSEDPFDASIDEAAPPARLVCATSLDALERIVTMNVAQDVFRARAAPCRSLSKNTGARSTPRQRLPKATATEFGALRARCRDLRAELMTLGASAGR